MNPYNDLKAYVDGELPALRMAELRELELTDTEWAAEVRQVRALGQTISSLSPQPQVVGLEETLAALHRQRPRSGLWRTWVPVGVCAALGVALVSTALRPPAVSDSRVAFELDKSSLRYRNVAPEAFPAESFGRANSRSYEQAKAADKSAQSAVPEARPLDPSPKAKNDRVAAPIIVDRSRPVLPKRESDSKSRVARVQSAPLSSRLEDTAPAAMKSEEAVPTVAVAIDKTREGTARWAVIRLASKLGVEVVSSQTFDQSAPSDAMEFVGDGPAVEELRRQIPSVVREAIKAETESSGLYRGGAAGGGGASPGGPGVTLRYGSTGGGMGGAKGGGFGGGGFMSPTKASADAVREKADAGSTRAKRLRLRFTESRKPAPEAGKGKVKP